MKKRINYLGILNIIFGVILAASMCFYFYYNATSHKTRQITHSYTEFNDWEIVHDDGTREKIHLPHPIDCSNDKKVVLEAVLPEGLTEADWINYSNGYDLDLYIDGELRKSFRETDSDLPGGVVKGLKQFCNLNHEDSGKVIRIERDKQADYVSEIFIGDALGLVSRYLLLGAGTYIMIIILILASAIVIITGIIFKLLRSEDSSLISLGCGVLVGSLWLLFDSFMYQFVFDNFYIDGNMSYIMAALMAFPFLVCINTLQKRRHELINLIFGIILLMNAIATCCLHFTEIADFEQTLLLSNIIKGIIVIAVLSILVVDLIKKRVKDTVQVYGLFIGIFCGLLEITYITLDPARVDGAFILTGLWIVLISAVVQQTINLWKAEQERQSAIHANKAKTEFLAKMSHEIRTPINAVLGMDEMILRETNEQNVKQYAGDIKLAANNLLDIINEILDLSKIEAGKMEIVPVNYKLGALLNSLYNMIEVKTKEKNLKLIFEVDENISSEFNGDDIRIRQVLVNLLTNAVKYTEKGEVKLVATMRKENEKAILKFSVIDTGIGIKEEDIEVLFSDYKRIDEKRNKYVEGTGLGMSITTQLLELMGSQLIVKSTYGEGSEFSFELEQDIVNETALGDFRSSSARQIDADKVMEYEAPSAKALIVDDNKVNIKVFSLLLKKIKMQICEAESGEECLEHVCKEKFDIIFLDHMMPHMDGIETLEKMKTLSGNLNGDTPIIMFTANAIEGAKDYYIEQGANDYLTKPVKPEALDKMILQYLDDSLIEYISE